MSSFNQNNSAEEYFAKALFYYDGGKVKRDFIQAEKWARRAAEAGHPGAQYLLANIFLLDCPKSYISVLPPVAPVPKDSEVYNLARDRYFELGEQGHSDAAQESLKQIFCFPWFQDIIRENGFPRNVVEGEMWLTKAAKSGFAPAQEFLGKWLLRNPRQAEEAFKWLLAAAKNNCGGAREKLSEIIYSARGTLYSHQKAIEFYKKLSDDGFSDASFFRGLMKFLGQGSPVDFQEAAYYLMLAGFQKPFDPISKIDFDRIKEFLEQACDKLSSEQVNIITSRAREFAKQGKPPL